MRSFGTEYFTVMHPPRAREPSIAGYSVMDTRGSQQKIKAVRWIHHMDELEKEAIGNEEEKKDVGDEDGSSEQRTVATTNEL